MIIQVTGTASITIHGDVPIAAWMAAYTETPANSGSVTSTSVVSATRKIFSRPRRNQTSTIITTNEFLGREDFMQATTKEFSEKL